MTDKTMNTKNKPGRTIKAVATIALATAASFAAAQMEKDLTAKVGHKYVSNVAETTIDDLVAEGYRMTDIEVVSTGPHRYAASFIKNVGVYKTGWWWKANQTEAEMTNFLNQHSARITDLETYVVDGVRRYAFVAVPNPSREFTEWWWFAGKSWADMNAFVQQKNGRLIDIEVEVVKGQRVFGGVLVRNAGQNHRNWIPFSNLTEEQVRKQTQFGQRADHMRLIDIERIGEDRYAGIFEETGSQAWWWLTDLDWEQVKVLQGQLASRIIDIERHVDGKEAKFDLLLLDNTNSLEFRMRNMLLSNSDGTKGFMLQEVNGPTLGAILPDFKTYPASTIKVLQHYYWSSRVWVDVDPLASVPIYTNPTDDVHTDEQIDYYLSYQQVTQYMMWNSGNTSTNSLMDWAGNGNGVIGRKNINNFGWNTLGLTKDIELHHKFADGGASNDPANVFTMRQITDLYVAYGNGVGLGLNQRKWMHDNMLNETGVEYDNFGFGVRKIMHQEGTSLGLTKDEVDAVIKSVHLVWKPGSVDGYVSSAGWVQLPFKTQNGVVYREFAVGAFIDDFSFATSTDISGKFLPEILRDVIVEMLDTWN